MIKKKKKIKKKFKVNTWIIMTSEYQNETLTRVIEIGKILEIADHYSPLLQEDEDHKDSIGYLIKTIEGKKQWVQKNRLERIFSPTSLGMNKKCILKLQVRLNKGLNDGSLRSFRKRFC